MSNAVFAFAEIALVFIVVIGLCVWELRKLKQYKEVDDADRARSLSKAESSEASAENNHEEGEEPTRGLFGVRREQKDSAWKR